MKSPPLTDEEARELDGWKPTRVLTTRDQLTAIQFRLAVSGVESTVIIGAPGTGKTTAVRAAVDTHAEQERAMLERGETTGAQIRTWWVNASDATGRKTGLIDVYSQVIGRAGTRMRQAFTPAELIGLLAQESQQRNIRALIIDEAQKISPTNLDQIRQILDAAAAEHHPFGIILIGAPALRDLVAQTGQLGQRYSGLLEFMPLGKHELIVLLPPLHPHLPRLRAKVGEPAWQAVASEIAAAASGSLRRLQTIIVNAHEMARSTRTLMTEHHLQLAVDKLAPES